MAVLIVALALTGGAAKPALADTSPPPGLPTTVSSDPLPTAQINGVVLTQVVVGNTVYAGGEFTRARPAGAAAGVGEVVRSNLMAYNIDTGALTDFAPSLNGKVLGVTASPDGSTLYVVGEFTAVNGQNRYRVAAFTTATGAMTSLAPNVNGPVKGATATASTLYIGGSFTAVNGTTRSAAAGLTVPSGALTGFAPVAGGGTVRQLVVSPGGDKVVLGGNFTTMNGSNNPGYGLAMLESATGRTLPLPLNSLVRNGGLNSAITGLAGNANGFYGTGYVYSKADGNFEGTFKADWNGNLTWVEDCHGDTYSLFPTGTEVYVAGHPHYCGNIGGFPQTDPTASWTYQRALAFSDDVRGTITREPYGYYNYEGRPRPALLHWLPDFNTGTYTGQTQGPWSVSGNANYVVYGGEFTRVNNVAQQGLVRFARGSLATNKDGPRLGGSTYVPTANTFAEGIRLTWLANYDRDNEELTHEVIKNGVLATPAYKAVTRSSWWQRPYLGYLDTAVTPGQSYTYQIRTTDPKGNKSYGGIITVTAAGGPSLSPYDRRASADGPRSYWPFDETAGSTAADITKVNPAVKSSGVVMGVEGILADQGAAYRFPGNSTGFVAGSGTAQRAPQTFSVEAWFKSTSKIGGKIIGFGNSATGSSTSYDRHLYMAGDGRLYFGVNPDARTIRSTTSYNDGQWHHTVATLSAAGLYLYVDGQQVAGNAAITDASKLLDGYWRIGGDALGNWPGANGASYFNGDIDNPAVYHTALTPAQVQAHFAARPATTGDNTPPTAAFTFATSSRTVAFDGTASTDPDGSVASYAWTFGDGTTGTTATPSRTYAADGTYPVTLTITDNAGATSSVTRDVVVAAAPPAGQPFASDLFNRTLATGLGSADAGGAWTVSDPAGFAVDSGVGKWKLTTPGVTRSADLRATPRADTDLTLNLTLDKSAVGGTTQIYVQGRRVGTNTEYRSVLRLSTANSLTVSLEALKGSATATTLAPAVTVGSFTPGTQIHVRTQAFGTNPTTFRTKVWLGGAAEPSTWTVSTTDAYAGLQAAGSVGLGSYISASASNTPVTLSVADLTARATP